MRVGIPAGVKRVRKVMTGNHVCVMKQNCGSCVHFFHDIIYTEHHSDTLTIMSLKQLLTEMQPVSTQMPFCPSQHNK